MSVSVFSWFSRSAVNSARAMLSIQDQETKKVPIAISMSTVDGE